MVARSLSRFLSRISRGFLSDTTVGISGGPINPHCLPSAGSLPHSRSIGSFSNRSQSVWDVKTPTTAFSEASGSSQTRQFHATGPMCMAKDFYSVLGVKKAASDSEIKQAYYKLAKEHHPDANKGDSQSEAKFQEIQAAYEVLKDKSKRSTYDQVGADNWDRVNQGGGAAPESDGGFGDFFGRGNPFGSEGAFEDVFQRAMRRGQAVQENFEAAVEISFREAVDGCKKRLEVPTSQMCEACDGRGSPPGVKAVKCSACRGKGSVRMSQLGFLIETTCGQCGGQGSLRVDCRSCGGEGRVPSRKEVDVKIPAGVDHGMTLKLRGMGGAAVRGAPAGDLFLHLKVQADPVFRRDGQNIHTEVPISFAQAALGTRLHAATLSGSVLLKVKAGTQPGETNVLRGKGIVKANGRGYGDQFVHYRVTVPTELTSRQRELLEELIREESEEVEESNASTG